VKRAGRLLSQTRRSTPVAASFPALLEEFPMQVRAMRTDTSSTDLGDWLANEAQNYHNLVAKSTNVSRDGLDFGDDGGSDNNNNNNDIGLDQKTSLYLFGGRKSMVRALVSLGTRKLVAKNGNQLALRLKTDVQLTDLAAKGKAVLQDTINKIGMPFFMLKGKLKGLSNNNMEEAKSTSADQLGYKFKKFAILQIYTVGGTCPKPDLTLTSSSVTFETLGVHVADKFGVDPKAELLPQV
jgi:hypothetical protein